MRIIHLEMLGVRRIHLIIQILNKVNILELIIIRVINLATIAQVTSETKLPYATSITSNQLNPKMRHECRKLKYLYIFK